MELQITAMDFPETGKKNAFQNFKQTRDGGPGE